MTNQEHQLNTAITAAILSIWGVIIAFGIITLISPPWLEELSNPGMNAEAINIKTVGDTYLKNNEPKKAINLYKSAIEIVPDYQAAIANLAIAYQKTRNYPNAIVSFKYLLENNPTHPDVIYFNLAEIEENMGKATEAINYFKLAAETAPYPENAFQKAAKLTMDQNRWEEAISLFDNAIENRMTLKNAYLGMIRLEVQSQSDSTPFNHTIPSNLNEIYDPSVFNFMLSKNTNIARTYNNMGFCQAKMGSYDLAIEHFKEALRIMPQLKDAQNNIKAVELMRKSEN